MKFSDFVRQIYCQEETAQFHCEQMFEGHSRSVTTVAFSPDGKHIASGSWDNTIMLWDAITGDYKKTLSGHLSSVDVVAFSPDGKHMASGFWDGMVKLWDVAGALKPSKYLGNTINSHMEYRSEREIKISQIITSLRYSENGQKIITNTGSFSSDVISYIHCDGSTSLEDLWVGDLWLWYGSMRLPWLAPNSQPRCYDANGDQIAVGFSSILVIVFNIDRRRLAIARELAV